MKKEEEKINLEELLAKTKIEKVDTVGELKRSFISYAMAVNVSRAIPDVRDGLKPVHRRILYSMGEMGNTCDKPFRKCARIVGEVMGKYHPHGDSSVYDALVRLAQDFSIRCPLVDGHGNFGSVDGDPPAAYRYTEARLSKIANLMIEDIEKETVDMMPNFDETLMQPVVLPSKIPNLLVNGSDGIAVGMATNIPPHNLTEVINGVQAYIDNPDITIDELVDFGYDIREARDFANDGCWEVQVPGKTNFSYHPFDSLRILHKEVLKDNTNSSFESFEELYQAYLLALREQTGRILEYEQQKFDNRNAPVSEWRWKESLPCSVVSLFEEDCIGRAASYYEGGAIYNVRSPHIGGAPDTVNSLYAIKKMVFEDKIVTLEELLACLRSNWENREALRLIAKNRYTYYGNDNDEVDELMARLVNDFAAICKELDGRCHINFPAGASTFGRQIEWREGRSATAFGAKKGEILSSNSSATPGTDNEGATALIKSYCKSDLSRMTTGCALDLKILPQVLRGEDGVEGLMGLMRGFLALGGFFMQIDTMDAATLLEAQKNPEKYKTLSVRISGWNARFVTLNEEWQNMIIERTSQGAI